MARGFVGRGRGSLPAPKRQIANDGLQGPNFAILTFGAVGTASALGSFGFLVTESAGTLVRTRGRIMVRVEASGTVNNQFTGAVGMLVVSAEAFAAGLAAISTPLDDIERAWYVYEPFAVMGRITGSSSGNDLVSVVEFAFDSRGQRKLKQGDMLVTVVECTQRSAVTGSVLSVAYQWRSQFKL